MNKLELLKQKLEQARKELNEKGYSYNPEMYSKGGYNELMKIKPFEIKYQDVIEEVFPDEAWWKVTNYWDIFDAMAFEGFTDETVIDEIIKHVDSAFLEESCKIEESDSTYKEIEEKCGCKVEDGHTVSEYMKKYGDEYENGELWDYSLEDFKSGAVEPQKGLVYWLVKDRDGELRVFETTKSCVDCYEPQLTTDRMSGGQWYESLNEGTSNFGRLRKFPLLVFYTYDEVEDMIRNSSDYPTLEEFTTDKGNGDFHVDYDAYYEACDKFEQDSWDKIETAVLDESQVEELEDAIYDFNEKTERIAEDLYDAGNEDDYYVLKGIQLKVEPGYYEAAYIDVDDEKEFDYLSDKVKEEQLKRFNDFFDTLKKDHHLSHYEVAWGPASNGETGYRKVESCENCEDDLGVEESEEFKVIHYADEYEGIWNGSMSREDAYNEMVKRWGKSMADKVDRELEERAIKSEDLDAPVEESAYDKIVKVLDDYGILYGDVVDYDNGKINIVGVDSEEWEEAQSAIESELGYEVDLPSGEGNDDELVVHVTIEESLKEDVNDYSFEELFWWIYGDEDPLNLGVVFKKTCDLIEDKYADIIWESDDADGEPEKLDDEARADILNSAKKEAESWRGYDIYNMPARYTNTLTLYKGLKKLLGADCKYLDESLKEDKKDKKKKCHINTNAGDPVKNAEFFNASMGMSGAGAVGEDLKEAPISGSDNLLSYNNEVKNILANVKKYIEENKDAQSVFDLISENMKEDIKYNIEHWARKGENLNTLVSKYQECVDEFAKAYKEETEKLSELTASISKIKDIIKNTKSTKESVNEGLAVNSNDTQVAVHDDSTVEVISDGGSVTVANGEVTINAGETEVVILNSGDTAIEVNKVEKVVPELGVEVTPEAEATAEVISDTVEPEVPEVETTEVVSSEEEVTEESLKEDKLTEEPVVNLDTRYDSRNSFYGKAKVDVKDDGSQILYSYSTPVCRITKDGEVKLLRKGYLGWFSSPTTLRHVKEFLKQNGKEIGTKAQLGKMYPTEDAYDYIR